jgi:hypothetical protein
MKTANKPHDPFYCGAKNRQGDPCRQRAGWGTDHLGSGRCKLHGGRSSGPPKGTQNALKHGLYTKAAIVERKRINRLIRDSRAFLN